jgi:raffinose synthase
MVTPAFFSTSTLSPEFSAGAETPGAFLSSRHTLRRANEVVGLIQFPGVKRWLALGPYEDLYWSRAVQGRKLSGVPAKTQFFLGEQQDGSVVLLLPLLAGDYVITAEGKGGALQLRADGGRPAPLPARTPVAFISTGPNPFPLIEAAVQIVAQRLKSFRPRQEKKTPAFVDYLGWCTWDAFYQKVTQADVFAGLASFQKGGIRLGFSILDDGWLDHQDDQLRSFQINRDKFPDGLAALVATAKRRYGLRYFGIWHAFPGYWRGVDPQGPLAQKYRLFPSRANFRHWFNKVEKTSMVDPAQMGRFYGELHRFFRQAGVDLIKVDVQSALTLFSQKHFGRVSAMKAYQTALQNSGMRNFNGNLIHCMCNNLDIAYQMKLTTVWRNSDDFFPKRTTVWQQAHIRNNALNSLWTSTFALPDWDMFQTHRRHGEYHAAARALSGGPIYVCDSPGKQNFAILRQLAAEDGRVWRCDRPAQPTRDSLFADSRKGSALLKIHNRSGAIGLLGIFHCSEKKSILRTTFGPADVPGLSGESFIAFHYRSQKIEKIEKEAKGKISLRRMGHEIITLSPIRQGWLAPLGRAERYVGATSLGKTTVTADGLAQIAVREKGDYLFWCAKKPQKIKMGATSLRFEYQSRTKLLKVAIPRVGIVHIQIFPR